MRSVARALLAGGLGFAVSCLAACGGGSGLLSGDQANTLNGQLDQISSAVAARNCGAAVAASQSFGNAVANMPVTVNSTLRADLNQGASTVSELAAKDCKTTATPTTPTATATTVTTSTTSPTATTHSTTTTTTTHTNPPPTTTSSNQTTTASGGVGVAPPSGQGGGGQGNGPTGGAGAGNGQ